MTIKTGSGIVNPPFTPATGGGRITLKSICLAILLCDLCFFIFSSWRRVYRSDIDSLAISIQDDSYYYLLPAFNLKTYGFFTFDGEHETYGFQPLYALRIGVSPRILEYSLNGKAWAGVKGLACHDGNRGQSENLGVFS